MDPHSPLNRINDRSREEPTNAHFFTFEEILLNIKICISLRTLFGISIEQTSLILQISLLPVPPLASARNTRTFARRKVYLIERCIFKHPLPSVILHSTLIHVSRLKTDRNVQSRTVVQVSALSPGVLPADLPQDFDPRQS